MEITDQTTITDVKKKSYFERNKKMIFVLLALLLIFCGLISVIFISSRSSENKAANGIIIDSTNSTEPIVSNPVITPTPDEPSLKEVVFHLNSNQFGTTYVPQITITVPTDTTTTVTNTDQITPTVELANSDFKLTFGIPYEISGVDTFKSNFVSLGAITSIDDTVYRVETSDSATIGYSNSKTIESGECNSIPQDTVFDSPCGNILISSQMMGITITCKANNSTALVLCDNAIKSMVIVRNEK